MDAESIVELIRICVIVATVQLWSESLLWFRAQMDFELDGHSGSYSNIRVSQNMERTSGSGGNVCRYMLYYCSMRG